MRVAVLEDDLDQRELLSDWLRLAGHSTHGFDRGGMLLRARREGFDALCLTGMCPIRAVRKCCAECVENLMVRVGIDPVLDRRV